MRLLPFVRAGTQSTWVHTWHTQAQTLQDRPIDCHKTIERKENKKIVALSNRNSIYDIMIEQFWTIISSCEAKFPLPLRSSSAVLSARSLGIQTLKSPSNLATSLRLVRANARRESKRLTFAFTSWLDCIASTYPGRDRLLSVTPRYITFVFLSSLTENRERRSFKEG